MTRIARVCVCVSLLVLVAHGRPMAAAGKVEGTFIVAGADAQLKFARAARTKLDDKGKMGYALLLSARNATGPIESWRTAEPAERGSFMVLILEQNGGVWVAELGHTAAKSGRFGVVSEVTTSGFHVQGDQLTVNITTGGEQQFTADRYNINLKVEATIEP